MERVRWFYCSQKAHKGYPCRALYSMKWLEYLNPYHYFTPDRYVSIWEAIFNTTLKGIWPRLIFIVCCGLAFWYGVRRQNWPAAKVFLIIAAIVAYGGGLLMLLGVI